MRRLFVILKQVQDDYGVKGGDSSRLNALSFPTKIRHSCAGGGNEVKKDCDSREANLEAIAGITPLSS